MDIEPSPTPLPDGWIMEDGMLRLTGAPRGRRPAPFSAREYLRQGLAEALEIDDARLLDRLLDLGITAELAPAFQALPLVEVAWASGRVEADERWLVHAAARSFGLEDVGAAHGRLDAWLAEAPAAAVFFAWTRFAERRRSATGSLGWAVPILEGAREVADAARGSSGPMSAAEKARKHEVLGRIRRTLRVATELDAPERAVPGVAQCEAASSGSLLTG